MFFNSLFKQLMIFSRSFPPKSTHVSSAYNTVNSSSETLKISLVNIIKRVGILVGMKLVRLKNISI